MSANATLAECCELIDEMRTIYSSSDDAVAVREARAAFGGLRAALDQRQGSLAASIREWTSKASTAQQRATPPEPEGAHAARLQSLGEQHHAAAHKLDILTNEVRALSQMEKDLSADTAAHAAQQHQVEAMDLQTIPDLRHELALYSSISRIQWHYEETGRLKGDVTNTEKGTVQHFDVDPTGMSDFDRVNHMWGVLAH